MHCCPLEQWLVHIIDVSQKLVEELNILKKVHVQFFFNNKGLRSYRRQTHLPIKSPENTQLSLLPLAFCRQLLMPLRLIKLTEFPLQEMDRGKQPHQSA